MLNIVIRFPQFLQMYTSLDIILFGWRGNTLLAFDVDRVLFFLLQESRVYILFDKLTRAIFSTSACWWLHQTLCPVYNSPAGLPVASKLSFTMLTLQTTPRRQRRSHYIYRSTWRLLFFELPSSRSLFFHFLDYSTLLTVCIKYFLNVILLIWVLLLLQFFFFYFTPVCLSGLQLCHFNRLLLRTEVHTRCKCERQHGGCLYFSLASG